MDLIGARLRAAMGSFTWEGRTLLDGAAHKWVDSLALGLGVTARERGEGATLRLQAMVRRGVG